MHSLAIIGGGIHGISIYLNLPEELQKNTIIIDAYPTALTQFYSRCDAIHMKYLRSPGSHTLIEPPGPDLLQFSIEMNTEPDNFWGKYYNPSLNLFKNFLNTKLSNLKYFNYINDEIIALELNTKNNSWNLKSKKAEYTSMHVILAIGNNYPYIPQNMEDNEPKPKHIFHKNFTIPNVDKKRVAIIGAGMTGSQIALSMLNNFDVMLISSSEIKISSFDSDPGFIGPKFRNHYLNSSTEEKLHILKTSRTQGSVNQYIASLLENAIHKKKLKLIKERLFDYSYDSKNCSYTLKFEHQADIGVDEIIFATGFKSCSSIVREDKLIQGLINTYNLPLSSQHTPLLENESLEWHTNLFLTGLLGELALGPPASNIIGAQMFSRIMKKFFLSLS